MSALSKLKEIFLPNSEGSLDVELTPGEKSLAELYDSGWSECPCLFVLSTGRVGTQTLTSLLNLAPNIQALHEPAPSLVKTSFDAYMDGSSLYDNAHWHDVIYAARDEQVFNAYAQGLMYTETNNRLTYLASALSTAFPASRFIHLHRHPYDVVRSGMRRKYYQQHTWDYARVRPRENEPDAGLWNDYSSIQKVAWYWAKVNEESKAFLGNLPKGRGYSLRADELFSGKPEVMQSLFSFVGASVPSEASLGDVLEKKLNAQLEGRFLMPTDWDTSQLSQVNEQVKVVAKALGYPLQ